MIQTQLHPAISYAYLLTSFRRRCRSSCLGTPNEETQYALEYFKKEAPRVIGDVSEETNRVALVDHNEVQQSATGVEKVEVEYVVDHHRIANFQTANPLFYRAEPVGCTNTILYKMYKEYGVDIPKDIAGLMVLSYCIRHIIIQITNMHTTRYRSSNRLSKHC